MTSRLSTISLPVLLGFSFFMPLSAQSGPFSLQIRTISPMESIRDTVGNEGGYGIGLGYVVVDKMDQPLRGEGILRLDGDHFQGRNGSSVKSYTAAFQINLYPIRHSDFYVQFAPVIQSHSVSPEIASKASYAGFGVQGGIGWALQLGHLYSMEISYLKMDRVESHNFSSLRYEMCFRF